MLLELSRVLLQLPLLLLGPGLLPGIPVNRDDDQLLFPHISFEKTIRKYLEGAEVVLPAGNGEPGIGAIIELDRIGDDAELLAARIHGLFRRCA